MDDRLPDSSCCLLISPLPGRGVTMTKGESADIDDELVVVLRTGGEMVRG